MEKREREQVFKRPSVVVCGLGIVGSHIKGLFNWADSYDIIPERCSCDLSKTYDYAFICTPTPDSGDGNADIECVKSAIYAVNAKIYVIKSTVPPGTTERITLETGKSIVFSPEYQGATQHANAEYGFVILGGDKDATAKVVQLYQYSVVGSVRFHLTNSRTAELCKYMENAFLATKVVFCNEFHRMARAIGVEYSELRELFICDPRVNPSHTFVYEDYPFYDSKCFNKDLPAIIEAMKKAGYHPEFIEAVVRRNDFFKESYLQNKS